MIPRIWPYKLGSKSARNLAVALESSIEEKVLRIRTNGRYVPRDTHLIVNWGNSFPTPIGEGDYPRWWREQPANGKMLNSPFAVGITSNKIECLNMLSGNAVEVPEYGSNIKMFGKLMRDGDASKVFCRTLTRANSGRGIVIAESPGELVPAPLYTVDVGKRREYRVHVFRGEILDFSQKKKLTTEQLEERGIEFCKDIRSHDNGWIFAREGVELPEAVGEVAIAAINALGLDFGAVDCYYTSRENPNPQVAGVFEVNTAPGLEGTTLERYSDAIRRLCGE